MPNGFPIAQGVQMSATCFPPGLVDAFAAFAASWPVQSAFLFGGQLGKV